MAKNHQNERQDIEDLEITLKFLRLHHEEMLQRYDRCDGYGFMKRLREFMTKVNDLKKETNKVWDYHHANL